MTPVLFIHIRQLFRLVRRYTRVDDFLNIAVHNFVQLVEREIDAVIGHAALRKIVGADLLGAVTGPDLAAPRLRLFVLFFLQLQII